MEDSHTKGSRSGCASGDGRRSCADSSTANWLNQLKDKLKKWNEFNNNKEKLITENEILKNEISNEKQMLDILLMVMITTD